MGELTMKSTRRSLIRKAAASIVLGSTTSRQLLAGVAQNELAPKKVPSGSTVGLIAPASAVSETQISRSLENCDRLGFTPVLGRAVRKQFGYLAGTDEERAADLNRMIRSREVDAIWCIRGGWGSARILDRVDFDALKRNPKPIMGYSDVTALLNAAYTQTGQKGYHGPNASFSESPYTEEMFLNMVTGQTSGFIENHPEAEVKTIRTGTAKGTLVGGNLTVLSHTVGSPYAPDCSGAILFLEDVSEAPYRVDRMLTHLKISGILDRISGFIFGTCRRCDRSVDPFTVEEIIEQHIAPLGIPAYTGASIGHIRHAMTVPLGVEVEMNASLGKFRILDNQLS